MAKRPRFRVDHDRAGTGEDEGESADDLRQRRTEQLPIA
jgi:hypothetical protein